METNLPLLAKQSLSMIMQICLRIGWSMKLVFDQIKLVNESFKLVGEIKCGLYVLALSLYCHVHNECLLTTHLKLDNALCNNYLLWFKKCWNLDPPSIHASDSEVHFVLCFEGGLALRTIQTGQRAEGTADPEEAKGRGADGGGGGGGWTCSGCHPVTFNCHTLPALPASSLWHTSFPSSTWGTRGELKVPCVTMEKLEATTYF